jgi:hypothetical protein
VIECLVHPRGCTKDSKQAGRGTCDPGRPRPGTRLPLEGADGGRYAHGHAEATFGRVVEGPVATEAAGSGRQADAADVRRNDAGRGGRAREGRPEASPRRPRRRRPRLARQPRPARRPAGGDRLRAAGHRSQPVDAGGQRGDRVRHRRCARPVPPVPVPAPGVRRRQSQGCHRRCDGAVGLPLLLGPPVDARGAPLWANHVSHHSSRCSGSLRPAPRRRRSSTCCSSTGSTPRPSTAYPSGWSGC